MRIKNGIRGSPMRSYDRHLNKLFDKGRQKIQDKVGCDLEYGVRDQYIGVG